ncbi:MAG: bacillithiol biosynthesis cysteine-adding enzyme BshC [Actinomycetota bacterium]|nr:bacillithiol biosynthesis cysteine-adding enzyme BshC [Actinomycetota bacterium]
MDFNIIELKNNIFYYSNLYSDYIFQFDKLKSFFSYDYRNLNHYKTRIDFLKKTYDNELRKNFCDELYEYNNAFRCSKRTLENIDILMKEDSFTLVAGQQPGIFTGPLYTVFKIISLISLSDLLSRKFKINVVPVFWNASEDNDIDEIKSINIPSGNLEKISIDIPEYLSKLSFSKIVLPEDEYENLVRKMLDSLQSTEYKAGIEKFLNRTLETVVDGGKNSGFSISRFFSAILSGLFSKFGLVIIDPEIAALKKFSRKIIDFDISKQSEIHGAIDFNSRELTALGYHNQLKLLRDNLDCFINTKNGREKIKINGKNNFYIQGLDKKKKELSQNELKDILFKNIGDTTLNVITRPLLQDWILPNIATVCGPGEISYFAQIKDVYTFFGIEMPIIVPRLSATIIEKKIKESMNKIRLDYENLELLPDRQAKETLKNMIGFDINSFLLEMEKEIHELINNKKEILNKHELDTAASFNRIENNLKKEIEVLGKRIISEYGRKNSFVVDSINKIHINLLPNKNLQERYVNIFEYINKYGFKIIDDIIEKISPMDFKHKFIEIK